MNGVAHCALQTARHLVDRGHVPLVVAPATAAGNGPDAQAPCPVVRVPSIPLPGYPQVRVALPSRRVAAAITEHRADIVHLASPFILGVRGMAAAARLRIPAVAIYQTDLAGYARTYISAGEAAAWRRIRSVHAAADRTLAPSSAAQRDLEAHGVPRVQLWQRGVDTVRFRPDLRDEAMRRELAPNGELIVGYVGRLAPEKHVELLAGACGLEGVRVVVVGDGRASPPSGAPCPGPSSSGAVPETSSPGSSPRWTSSCTRARSRPSARPCRSHGQRCAGRRARRRRTARPGGPRPDRTARPAR